MLLIPALLLVFVSPLNARHSQDLVTLELVRRLAVLRSHA